MKLLKLTLLTVAIGAMFFLFYKGQAKQEEKRSEVVSRLLGKQHKESWGESIFNEGAYQAVKNISIENACGTKSQHGQLFCREGYQYITYIKKFNELSAKVDNQKLSQIINVDSVVKGLSLGMALTIRNLDPIVFDEKSKYRSFIDDGWGFSKTLNYLARGVLEFSQICQKLESKKYCLFGQGRAFFIDHQGIAVAESLGDYAKQGYLFAEIFATKDKNMSEHPIQKLALDLKSNSSKGKYRNCVLNDNNHFLDCAEAGARL